MEIFINAVAILGGKREKEKIGGEKGFSPLKKMQKVKHLPPSMREKKRYIVYEVVEGSMAPDELLGEVRSTLGLFESAEAGVQSIAYKDDRGILRVSNRYVDKARVALALVEKALVRVVRVSGSLKKAKDYL